jgi:hypothetical protein
MSVRWVVNLRPGRDLDLMVGELARAELLGNDCEVTVV